MVLPDLTSPAAPSPRWGAAGPVRALLRVLWGGSGQPYRCEGALELLGRPAGDWTPAGLQADLTYLDADREEMLELPAGAHSSTSVLCCVLCCYVLCVVCAHRYLWWCGVVLGAVAGWGCTWPAPGPGPGPGREDGAQAARRFFAAADASGAQSTLRSLPRGLATLLGPDRDFAVQLTAGDLT